MKLFYRYCGKLIDREKIKKGSNEFYIEEAEDNIARIHFILSGTDIIGKVLIIVHHTVVYLEPNGHGLGKQLVNILVECAREEKMYIIPLCST